MAIYFNDLILEPKEDGTSLQKRYHAELKNVKSLFAKFRRGKAEGVLTFGREYRKVYNTKKTSFKPAPPIAIPMNVNLYDDQLGSVEIRYSKRPPIRNGKSLTWPRDQESLIFENLTISEQRLDLAWFILYASDFVKRGVIKLIDKEVEYEGTVDKMKKQLEVSSIIFSDDTTLETLQVIADLAFKGQINLTTNSKAEMASKMWSLISVNETNKKAGGYDDFLKTAAKVEAKLEKTESKADNIDIELINGEKYNVPILKCPPSISNEKLQAKAVEYNVPSEGLSRDVLYSIIKSKTT